MRKQLVVCDPTRRRVDVRGRPRPSLRRTKYRLLRSGDYEALPNPLSVTRSPGFPCLAATEQQARSFSVPRSGGKGHSVRRQPPARSEVVLEDTAAQTFQHTPKNSGCWSPLYDPNLSLGRGSLRRIESFHRTALSWSARGLLSFIDWNPIEVSIHPRHCLPQKE